MRLLICASILLAACADADKAPQQKSAIELAGNLESRSLREASGLARSNIHDDLIWAINDDGPPDLYALGPGGEKRGKVRLEGAKNRDWEDLASFVLDGRAYLLIADIGDNEGQRKDVTLYITREPSPDDDKTSIAWEIEFTYPEGPRDAEAIAVHVAARQILVLSKRDIPARLYALPLRPDTDRRITAEFLGTAASLPQPSRRDVNNALALKDWHWQPTGMDISTRSDGILILSYHAIYYYARRRDESWIEALRRSPLGLPLGEYKNAEAIAFAGSDDVAYVTTEGEHAPLLRVDLSGTRTIAAGQRSD